MRLFLAAMMIVGLTACAPKPARMPVGAKAPPPIGAVDYCVRNPEDELCRNR